MNYSFEPFRHPDFHFEVIEVGAEKQKAIVIDDLIGDATSLIEYALRSSSPSQAAGLYPGLRSPSPDLYGNVLLYLLKDIICGVFDLEPKHITTVDSTYSLVATPLEYLEPYQRIPHYDQPHPNEIAMIHYLCNEKHGGTSFYRHRSTGYEFIDRTRVEKYRQKLQDELRRVGLPEPPSYINGDTELFEKVWSVNARFNRCLIYRCSSLHSGDIPSDYAFDMNPWTGRFTMTSFLHG